jgi:hypothetical protein
MKCYGSDTVCEIDYVKCKKGLSLFAFAVHARIREPRPLTKPATRARAPTKQNEAGHATREDAKAAQC